MKQWLKDFTHNCIVHPLMMFIPKKLAHNLHDRNANWAFGLNRYDELTLEGVHNQTTTDTHKEKIVPLNQEPKCEVLVLMDQYETTKKVN